jgi:hypothetical protein
MKAKNIKVGSAYLVQSGTKIRVLRDYGASLYSGMRAVVTQVGVPEYITKYDTGPKNQAMVMTKGGRETKVPLSNVKMLWSEYEDWREKEEENRRRLDTIKKEGVAAADRVRDLLGELGVTTGFRWSQEVTIGPGHMARMEEILRLALSQSDDKIT